MEIDRHFCDGQKWNTHAASGEGDAGAGKAPLIRGTKAMRDVADDLATLTPAVITSPDAPAAAGIYTQADIQDMVDLINEMKAALNAISSGTIKTTKSG